MCSLVMDHFNWGLPQASEETLTYLLLSVYLALNRYQTIRYPCMTGPYPCVLLSFLSSTKFEPSHQWRTHSVIVLGWYWEQKWHRSTKIRCFWYWYHRVSIPTKLIPYCRRLLVSRVISRANLNIWGQKVSKWLHFQQVWTVSRSWYRNEKDPKSKHQRSKTVGITILSVHVVSAEHYVI